MSKPTKSALGERIINKINNLPKEAVASARNNAFDRDELLNRCLVMVEQLSNLELKSELNHALSTYEWLQEFTPKQKKRDKSTS